MKKATLTIEIRASQTLLHLNWYNAFYRGELIAQTNKETDAEGLADLLDRARPVMLARGYELNTPKILPQGERHDKDANYPHEHF